METAIYHDELKCKPGKKHKAGVCETEQSLGKPSGSIEEVRVQDAEQAHSEQETAGADELTVKVLRVCPNPRLVLCAYSEGGTERRVLVRVKRNANFRRGMDLKAVRSASETEPWVYEGRLPRFAGRW
jgi:hypothetical protein